MLSGIQRINLIYLYLYIKIFTNEKGETMKTSASINGILKRELEQLFGQQDANIETAAQCLKVMFHPPRLRILCALREGEQTVQNLEYHTGIKQSTLLQHLTLVKSRVVLVSRRESTYSGYR